MFDLDVSPPNLPSPPSPSCVIPRRFAASDVNTFVRSSIWLAMDIGLFSVLNRSSLPSPSVLTNWSDLASVFLIASLASSSNPFNTLSMDDLVSCIAFSKLAKASEDSNIDLNPAMSADVPRNIRQVEYCSVPGGAPGLDESLFSSLAKLSIPEADTVVV